MITVRNLRDAAKEAGPRAPVRFVSDGRFACVMRTAILDGTPTLYSNREVGCIQAAQDIARFTAFTRPDSPIHYVDDMFGLIKARKLRVGPNQAYPREIGIWIE